MVETSTLTPHQELVNKLGTGHPQKQILEVLRKVEVLAERVKEISDKVLYIAKKKTKVEALAMARKAKKEKANAKK